MRAVTAAQMREIDRRAREEFGIPELVLMEHAGTAAARAVRRLLKPSRLRAGVVVLCGGGANGGDGFVAARHLSNWGFPVSVVLLADERKVQGASRVNLEILHRMGVAVQMASSAASWRRWSRRNPRAGLVLDAMLGTGVEGRVREPVASAIRWTNRRRCPVVAMDIPSGLSSDTGLPCGAEAGVRGNAATRFCAAVRATETVTCGLPKIGLAKGRGKRFSGRVTVADISLPSALTR